MTDESFTLDADVVFKAIGQKLDDEVTSSELGGVRIEHGKIVVDESQATSLDKVWAGGDCATGGDDLTVTAVQQGKVAAMAIHRSLTNG